MNNSQDGKNETNIKIIMRQTNYDRETIIKKLEEHNNNIEKIILEYFNIDLEEKKKKESDKLSMNQKIFKSIRDYF